VARVRADRHEDHAKELLAGTGAIVTSDRWWAYAHLPLKRRQISWAHLRRDFKAHADGLAAEKAFGEAALRICWLPGSLGIEDNWRRYDAAIECHICP
jgi:transposase